MALRAMIISIARPATHAFWAFAPELRAIVLLMKMLAIWLFATNFQTAARKLSKPTGLIVPMDIIATGTNRVTTVRASPTQ